MATAAGAKRPMLRRTPATAARRRDADVRTLARTPAFS
jgi:hypothetical protein